MVCKLQCIWEEINEANGAYLAAFLSALIVGVSLHYHKIVQNEYYGYPDEWFPSVSATIGDRYPERSSFMVFIAITSGTECDGRSLRAGFNIDRSSIRIGRIMVPPHSSAQCDSAQICGIYGCISNLNMRRMDICHIYG